MTAMDNGQGKPKTPIIETAAGTTDPDNAKSGNKAYAIAAAALVGLLVVGTGLSGCINLINDIVGSSAHQYGSGSNGQPYYQYYDEDTNYDDPLEFLEDYMDDTDGNTYYDNGQPKQDDTTPGMSKKVSAKDALGSELAMYQSTIDAALAKSSYANAQQSVRTFVRALVLIDRDASSEIATSLHSAAWNDKDISQAIGAAKQKSDETVKALQEEELPEVAGGKAKDVTDRLESGRKHAIERWEAVSSELELLESQEELDSSALTDAEKRVAEAAQGAAEDFAQAMSDSVDH